ncbi:MAG: stage II sporulation protein R [Clostridia bacterium]
MKKTAGILFVIVAIALLALLIPQKTDSDYIRIHIRANSDEASDQNIKYLVRDSVVEYLIPQLAICETSSDARTALKKSLPALEKLASDILKKEGYPYGAKASMKRETFPARSYGEFVLDAGVYDALIIELGSGDGDNWWCVAFPPLCFIPDRGSEEIEYKSKILELIKKYGEKNNG